MHIPSAVFERAVGFEILNNVIASQGNTGICAVLCRDGGLAVRVEDVLALYLGPLVTHDADVLKAAAARKGVQGGFKHSGGSHWCLSRYRDDAELPEVCKLLGVPDDALRPFLYGPRGGKRQGAEDVYQNLKAAEQAMLQLLRGKHTHGRAAVAWPVLPWRRACAAHNG